MHRLRNSCFNALLIALSTFLALEAAGYASGRLFPQLYDPSAALIAGMRNPAAEAEFQGFLHNGYSPLTGWAPPLSDSHTEKDCLHIDHHFTTDADGARIYPGYAAQKAEVLITGDSFTRGDEIEDNETIAARIYHHSGIVTANLGFRAFDPVQGFLLMRSLRPRYPHAKIAVLGIMTENINRMASSFSGIYFMARYNGYAPRFGIKPYMEKSALVPVDTAAMQTYPAFLDKIKTLYATNYWSRPAYRFPYSLALVKALTSHAFRDVRRMDYLARENREYAAQYANPELSGNLLALLKLYSDWAEAEHLVAIAFFIPHTPGDLTTPALWIENHRAEFPANLHIHSFDATGMDLTRYNLNNWGSCHPTAYAADQIARQYVTIITGALQPPHK